MIGNDFWKNIIQIYKYTNLTNFEKMACSTKKSTNVDFEYKERI